MASFVSMKMPFLAHNNVYQSQEEIKRRMQTKYEKTCSRTFARSNHHAKKDLARDIFKGGKQMHEKRFDFV